MTFAGVTHLHRQIQKNPQQHANFDKSFAQGGVDLKEKKGKRGITCMFVPQPLQKRKSIHDWWEIKKGL